MSTIPISVTEEQFNGHIRPHVSTARRGYECKIPLYKVFNYILYRLHTGCQWDRLPIDPDPTDPTKGNQPGCGVLPLSQVEPGWKPGASVGAKHRECARRPGPVRTQSGWQPRDCQERRRVGGLSGRQESQDLQHPALTDANGYVVACTGIVAGNHNDAFNLKPHLQAAFKSMKRLGLNFRGAYFNADAAVDTRDARRVCFRYGLRPNIAENPRNRKSPKRGRKRLFNPDVYKHRFSSERSFAWVDKFRALLLRFDRKDAYFLGAHHIAFAMINLRHVLA